jgi:hypothetical protein
VCVGDQGINLDLIESWSYHMPTPDAKAAIKIIFASGRADYFMALAADALNWWLSKDAPDLERAYMDYWTATAARAAQTARAQAGLASTDEE